MKYNDSKNKRGNKEMKKRSSTLQQTGKSAGTICEMRAGSTIPRKKNMSVLDKIVFSIRSLKDGPNGSSRQAVNKFLKSEFNYENRIGMNKACKLGVKKGILTRMGQRFRVALDKYDDKELKIDVTVQTIDLLVGQGDKETQNGDIVTIMYVGTLEDGTEFDCKNSFTFLLGCGEVLKGLDKGLLNMRVGGKRRIVIPGRLGFGRKGCPPVVPPHAVLHFEVMVKAIERI